MLFSIFLYQHFLKTNKTKYLFLSGIIASLAALSKQFAGIIFGFIFFHLLFKKIYKKSLFSKKSVKELSFFLIPFSLILLPYLFILLEAGGLYISYLVGFKYALWTGEPTSPLNPAYWTFYLTESAKRFYLLPLVLAFFIFYLYKKEKHWIEMLAYFLLFYLSISLVPNKEVRFSQYFLLPVYVATAFYFSKFNSKILFFFFIGYTLLSLYPIRTTFVYYPTQEVSQFVYENLPNGANVAISSEKPYTFSSVYMFHLSVLNKNRSIIVYRPCAFDNKTSEEILTILKENNIYFILEDLEVNDNTFVKLIRNEVQEVQVDNIKNINLYFVKNFTYTEPTEKCNIICLTQEKICIKEVI